MTEQELERSIEIAIDEGRNGNMYWDEVRREILSLLAREREKARKYDYIANLISTFPGKQKYPQIMEAINLLRRIEGIVKEPL